MILLPIISTPITQSNLTIWIEQRYKEHDSVHITPDVIWLPGTLTIPSPSCKLFANHITTTCSEVRWTSDVTVTSEVLVLDSSISSMCQWLAQWLHTALLEGNVGLKSPASAVEASGAEPAPSSAVGGLADVAGDRGELKNSTEARPCRFLLPLHSLFFCFALCHSLKSR